ncbi:MAG TPA: hypothetical protein VF458_13345 [Ktedonobacteraceae bacterium]
MKRLLALCMLSFVLLAGLQACDLTGSLGSSSTPTAIAGTTPTAIATSTPVTQPIPTGTASGMAADITRIITAYYNAVKAKNYTQAYTYLDPNATNSTTGKPLTQSSFTQLGQELDHEEGPVVSIDIGIFPPSPQVTMTIMRSKLGPYHAQLNMKQEDNTWKITSLDRI